MGLDGGLWHASTTAGWQQGIRVTLQLRGRALTWKAMVVGNMEASKVHRSGWT